MSCSLIRGSCRISKSLPMSIATQHCCREVILTEAIVAQLGPSPGLPACLIACCACNATLGNRARTSSCCWRHCASRTSIAPEPSGSFLPYAGSAKILAVVAMLLGRLEIFPPLTIVFPSFWLQRSRRGLGFKRRKPE